MDPSSLEPSYSSGEPGETPLAEGTAHTLNVPRDDDHELVRRMASGDSRALGTLFDRWSTLINSVAMRIVQDPSEAEEIVEDTF